MTRHAEGHSILQRAWELRFNQKQDACFLEFARLKQILPLLEGSMNRESVNRAMNLPEKNWYLSAFCLRASFERWKGRLGESQALLSLLEEELTSRCESLPAILLLQLGLNQIAFGNSHRAMEYFMDGCAKSENDLTGLSVEINLAECVDNLGLDGGNELTMKRLEERMHALSSRHDLSSFRSSCEQLQLRRWLRAGEFSRFCQGSVVSLESQNDFVRIWAQQLPYHAYSHPPVALQVLKSRPTFFQRSYRLATLYGLAQTDNTATSDLKPSDWVDRVYLWVWRWLINPLELPLAQVITALSAVSFSAVKDRLCAEDRVMLRNALGWIGLFDRACEKALQALQLQLTIGPVLHAPLFEFEGLWIAYWSARRTGNLKGAKEIQAELSHHRLYESPEILFRRFFETTGDTGPPGDFTELKKRLEVQAPQSLPGRPSLTIDMSRFEIFNHSKNRKTISETICLALEVFSRQKRLTLEEFAFVVFKMTRFDPYLHQPKIYNLLSRIKALVHPHLKIKGKCGVLFTEGNWSELSIQRESEETCYLRQCPEWREFLGSRAASKSGGRPSPEGRLDFKQTMRRWEIENVAGKSRATTTRLLSRWEKQGWVKRKGKSRSTEYVLDENFIDKLRNGEIIL
jgi:hypothetical protein